MFQTIGTLFMIAALVFMSFGIWGIFKFNNFFSRILIASKVDTVGYITLMVGVIIYRGLSPFSVKVLLIVVLMTLINPLVSHVIARSAHYSGYRLGKD